MVLLINRKLYVVNRKSNDEFHPKKDGIGHINVSVKGKTKIGRILSNPAKTPFILHDHQFQSVEGFLQSQLSYNHDVREKISKGYGLKARRYSKEVKIKDGDPIMAWNKKVIIYKSKDWDDEVKKAVNAKIEQSEWAKNALISTGNLPLVHYHVKSGNVIINESFIPDYLMEIRAGLKTIVQSTHRGVAYHCERQA